MNKFKFFAQLEWIFWRIAREQLSALYKKDENRFSNNTIVFLKNTVDKDVKVLDLGCAAGEISYLLSPYCKSIFGIDYDEKLIS